MHVLAVLTYCILCYILLLLYVLLYHYYFSYYVYMLTTSITYDCGWFSNYYHKLANRIVNFLWFSNSYIFFSFSILIILVLFCLT